MRSCREDRHRPVAPPTLSVVSFSPGSVSSDRRTTPVYQPETATHSEPVSESQPVLARHSAEDWVSFQLHREALERFIARGSRVLEANAGTGQYTEVLAHLGCAVNVLDESPDALHTHRERARSLGYEGAIESSATLDLCALTGLPDAGFDAVVAYGAALSYAFERRDRALAECIRVLKPRGVLIIDALSLWGTMHRQLPFVLARDLVQNRAVIRSGNAGGLLPGDSGRQRHLFRAAELDAFLRRGGLELLWLSASSALSTGVELPAASDPSTWSALLEYERAACVERGYLDSGSQLLAVARR
jgi:S-adenosylmethionine-dependent methyltransferase